MSNRVHYVATKRHDQVIPRFQKDLSPRWKVVSRTKVGNEAARTSEEVGRSDYAVNAESSRVFMEREERSFEIRYRGAARCGPLRSVHRCRTHHHRVFGHTG